MTDEVKRRIDAAVALKRKGNYDGARRAYYDMLEEYPSDARVYYALAKVLYLQQEPHIALVNYLCAMHLYLQEFASDIRAHTRRGNVFADYLSQFPDETLEWASDVYHPWAPYVFLDPNTPRHAAHCVIDFHPLWSHLDVVIEISQSYRRQIAGDRTYLGHDPDVERSLYLTTGQQFMLDNLRWDHIEDRRPDKIYLAAHTFDIERMMTVFSSNFLRLRHPQSNS
ncbi:MAG: hypothetical protein Kow0047_15430 [Anaerolineae bacterium]